MARRLALPALRERLDSGAEFHTFTDVEALEALDHIIRTKPPVVALELEFSSSTRGTALINRIKDDPSLTGCEVRVIAHDSEVQSHRGRGAAAAGARGGGREREAGARSARHAARAAIPDPRRASK